MWKERSRVLENSPIAPGHYLLKVRSPRIARAAAPGKFVQVLCADSSDPLLPRPFSFLDAGKNDLSIIYHVVGKGTKLLSQVRRGEEIGLSGPLGNGFTLPKKSSKPSEALIALVGGGVGIPPLYHLAKWLTRPGSGARKDSVHVFLGARKKDFLLCEKDFRRLGVHLHLATDDGSKGHRGFVTEPLADFLESADPATTRVQVCGPTPMMKAASALSAKFGVSCEVSVEVPMACGFGACLGCAIKVVKTGADRARDGYRYAIACYEGPVFQGSEVLWD